MSKQQQCSIKVETVGHTGVSFSILSTVFYSRHLCSSATPQPIARPCNTPHPSREQTPHPACAPNFLLLFFFFSAPDLIPIRGHCAFPPVRPPLRR